MSMSTHYFDFHHNCMGREGVVLGLVHLGLMLVEVRNREYLSYLGMRSTVGSEYLL